MRVAIIVLGVLLCSAAMAEPQPWMKSDDPDTMLFTIQVDNCPFAEAEIQEVVKGVLVRSRLKGRDYFEGLEEAVRQSKLKDGEPRTREEILAHYEAQNYLLSERLGFSLQLQCSPGKGQMNNYSLDLYYIRFIESEQRSFFETSTTYGGFGLNHASGIKTYVKGEVERLVSDWLQANFDL